jgi:hypothetical protein
MVRVVLELLVGELLSVTVIVSLAPVNDGFTTNQELTNVQSVAILHPWFDDPGKTERPDMVQVPPAVPKLVPVTVTLLPRWAGLGVNVIAGTTLKVAVAESIVLAVRVIFIPDLP